MVRDITWLIGFMEIDLHKEFVKLKFRVLALLQSRYNPWLLSTTKFPFKPQCFLIDSVYLCFQRGVFLIFQGKWIRHRQSNQQHNKALHILFLKTKIIIKHVKWVITFISGYLVDLVLTGVVTIEVSRTMWSSIPNFAYGEDIPFSDALRFRKYQSITRRYGTMEPLKKLPGIIFNRMISHVGAAATFLVALSE